MAIPTEDLAAVRTLVTHRMDDGACADGVAAALICCDALPELEDVRFVRYNSPEHIEMVAAPGMLFVDFTPHPSRIADFVAAGAWVLDHHEKQRAIVAAFGARGVYADEPGVSGAMLALREVWEPMAANRGARREMGESTLWGRAASLAKRAGIRDTWQKDSPLWLEACDDAAALRFWPWHLLRAGGLAFLDDRLGIGPILRAKDTERDALTLASAHCDEIYGLKVVMFEGLHTSDIAEQLGAEADVVLGWHLFDEHEVSKMTVSVRSRGSRFRAGDFAAAQLGGGGHAGAAGFTLTMMPDDHPRTVLRDFVSGSASR